MNVRLILTLAKQEVTQYSSAFDKRTIATTLVLLALVGGLLYAGGGAASVTQNNGGISNDIYRIGTPSDTVYHDAFEAHPQIRVTGVDREAFEAKQLDAIVYADGRVDYHPTDKSFAALSAAEEALKDYNTQQLRAEPNQTAAFPVQVSLTRIAQDGADTTAVDNSNDASNDGSDGNGSSVEGVTGINSETGDVSSGGAIPADIQPPFPYDAIALAVLFVVPMNFIVQSYSSSLISDRVTKRTELLLVSPASSFDMIVGKTLPYFAALVATTVGLGLYLGVSALSMAAVLSLALTFLAAGFLGGLFARSFKELTFIISTASILLIMFAFVPALFTTVHPISVISPLSMVVFELRGTSVSMVDFLFSTLPLTFTGLVMFAFGSGVFREEELFTQKPVPAKLLQMLSAQVSSWKSPFWMSMALMPFVFAAELLAIALLFVVPIQLSVPVLLGIIAVIEEVAKSAVIYAGYTTGKLKKSLRVALLTGLTAGLGFFVIEKVTVVTQAVGLLDVALGSVAFGGVAGGGVFGLLFAVLWIGLHSLTTIISAIGALKGRWGYLVGLVVASIVHVAYNLGVIAYA